MRHEKYYMSEKGGPDTRDPLWICLKCVCVHQQQTIVELPRWRHHDESQQHSVVLEQKYCTLLWCEGILLL